LTTFLRLALLPRHSCQPTSSQSVMRSDSSRRASRGFVKAKTDLVAIHNSDTG
jgi:hypothetical protein